MNIVDLEFVKGFIRMCNDGFNQGWHERNGGNLTYRIKDEERAEAKENLDFSEKSQNDYMIPNVIDQKIRSYNMVIH